tara:strand:+ start:590 stop:1276 length:687 start_codon:yes stop_codon:yes gene_type:complete
MRRWSLLIIFFLGAACTNDYVIQNNKAGFADIYKNILLRSSDKNEENISPSKTLYNKKWLTQFNQPIIGLSSPNHKEQATLVALGNQNDKLTWVSADGISISFANGVLIATRGYSQDLMEARHNDLDDFFTQNTEKSYKTFRYLNGENGYSEIKFSCSVVSKASTTTFLTDLKIKTTKFTENCSAGSAHHTNEYYVLPNTNIILKSKQWISEANGYIDIYNYYAFQNN